MEEAETHIDNDSTLTSLSAESTLNGSHKMQVAKEDHIFDVVIVGAGLAGLSAARTLSQAGIQNFVVLEARERVGGRTLDETTPGGSAVEMGGQWISPGHGNIISLSRELNVPTFNVYDQGQTIYRKNGRTSLFKDTIPCGILTKLDLYLATRKLNRLARSVPASESWKGKDAVKHDQQSVGAWIEANLRTREGKILMGVAVQAVYGETVQLISLLDLLSSITSAGGDIEKILDDAQSIRLLYGPQSLSRGMAKEMGGDKIKFHETLRKVQCDDESRSPSLVHVMTNSQTYRCKSLILTMPRVLLGKVQIEPSLPTAMNQLFQHQPMGSVIKINIVYSRPFWRERGLNGAIICSDVESPIQITYDNSPADGKEGVLVTFMSGAKGREHFDSSVDTRRRMVLDKLIECFGEEAGDIIAYHDKVWAADAMSLGAYGSYNPPGVLTAFQRTTTISQVGKIYLAGDGSSEAWQGYMEGAIMSGQQTARDVLEML